MKHHPLFELLNKHVESDCFMPLSVWKQLRPFEASQREKRILARPPRPTDSPEALIAYLFPESEEPLRV